MADKAGKGVLYFSLANAVFFAISFAISIALARILELGAFGIYGVVISLVSTVNLVFVNGFKQTISKFVSEESGLTGHEKRQMFFSILSISLVIFLLLFFGSGIVAGLLNDSSLIPFIQIVSFLVVAYAVHSFFMGYLNGLRKFGYEAFLRTLYSVFKLAFIVGLAALTLNIFYAFLGFVLASFAIVIVGFFTYRHAEAKLHAKKAKTTVNLKRFFRFALPLIAFVLITTLLTNLDLLMVKAITSIEMANAQSAYYTVASTISRLPFYAVMALVAVLLPIISNLSHRKKVDQIKFYVRQVNRYSLMFLGIVTVLISATSAKLVSFLFGQNYLAAGPPLSILVFGIGFFALFSVIASIVSGHGRPQVAMIVAFLALALDFGLNLLLIPGMGVLGAAYATTFSMLFALVALSAYMVFSFKALCSSKSILRIFAAGAIAYLAAIILPFEGFALALTYAIACLLFAGFLLLSGELSQKDFSLFKQSVL